ncbi:hypothetical protein WJX84_002498 [Apatococcus fuscideae]|uniref:PCI domain-containing protein n=1 Tax=Apatococcus fuscideae TaxID=2026836 RepID=A0AAW1T0A6_9CHLO
MGAPSDEKKDGNAAHPSSDKVATAPGSSGEDSKEPTTLTVAAQLRANVALLERAVEAKDTRLIVGRLLRQTAAIRRQLQPQILTSLVENILPESCPSRGLLLEQLSQASGAMDTGNGEDAVVGKIEVSPAVLPELEAYAILLVLMSEGDSDRFNEAKQLTEAALKRLGQFNRRTLDGLAARIYFYYAWAHERTGTLATIRSTLLALQRTSTLRHDEYGQETLLNLLLRNYLHFNLYDQAEKLRSKTVLPEQWRSTQQYCRYLYYLGRIRSIQLDYTDARECLQQAVRKAPTAAYGFRVEVQKWLILVRLLLGEIPERTEFEQEGLKDRLQPYLQLTQTVRIGDLNAFKQVALRHQESFAADRVHNLIVRLHHNVIRTGLRRINLAYSRISLADVASKLGLPSVEDTESIIGKAIRDGGIDAVLDHEQGWMRSRQVADVYATAEPQSAFHARIAFCLDLHNEAVKAMHFDDDGSKGQLESADARKDRLAQEAELAQAIQDNPDGDDDL